MIIYDNDNITTVGRYGYVTGATTTEHLQSQSYKVCMRQEAGYCSIRHSTQTSSSFDFTELANAAAPDGAFGSTACYLDYIGIPGGSLDGNPATFDRFCGIALAVTTGLTTTNHDIISKLICIKGRYP